MSPDRELIRNPKWRPEDLGAPLPDSAHANSVCLPTWQDVVDYEERQPRVISKLQAGYPRFVIPAQCAAYFEVCRTNYARTDERCHAYPSNRSARRCAYFIKQWSGLTARVVECHEHRLHIVCFPAAAEKSALKYWRHTGEGISSRQAESLLAGIPEQPAAEAKKKILERIARLAGVPHHCIYFFKSGMAAIYAAQRAIDRLKPRSTAVQFGFPYVDTLKILQEFGNPALFYPKGDAADLRALLQETQRQPISAIFCELPSNPLLRSPDLRALSGIARAHHAPLVVDDTLATWVNVDLTTVADVTVTSLTKYFTGRGDVMAGAAIINPQSPFFTELRNAFNAEFEDHTWGDTIILLEQHSRDFESRVKQINDTTRQICAWLKQHPAIESVYYPEYETKELFDQFKRNNGGYGGLFSIVLRDPEKTTPVFYEHLEISKGPNLGTTFSLCCPFTLLAHYDELDWAEKCGVSRYLLRFSIGLEPAKELIGRLQKALQSIA